MLPVEIRSTKILNQSATITNTQSKRKKTVPKDNDYTISKKHISETRCELLFLLTFSESTDKNLSVDSF